MNRAVDAPVQWLVVRQTSASDECCSCRVRACTARPEIVRGQDLLGPVRQDIVVLVQVHEVEEGLADVPRRGAVDLGSISFGVSKADGPLVTLEYSSGPRPIEAARSRIMCDQRPVLPERREVAHFERGVMNPTGSRERVDRADQRELMMDNASVEGEKNDGGAAICSAGVASVAHAQADRSNVEVDHGLEIANDESNVTETHDGSFPESRHQRKRTVPPPNGSAFTGRQQR